MREETNIYPFIDRIYFASKSNLGTTYLTHKKAIVEIDGKLHELELDNCFAQGHILDRSRVLLVRNQNFGLLEEIFSFDLVVIDIFSKEIHIASSC